MRVALLDYGCGNLHSLERALAHDGVRVDIEPDPERAARADVLVLPGVGAFGAAACVIAPARDALRAAILGGLPTIGICLGMQLLFDGSDEDAGVDPGLGVFPGRVTRLEAERVPHMGWNSIEWTGEAPAHAALELVYFANSFACRPADTGIVSAWSQHDGDRFPAIVHSGNITGVQFHPEKSSDSGVRYLRSVVSGWRRP